MTTEQACNELLQKFNILWNNIASDKAPGLNEYEISVFLTKGQEDLVKDYFSGRTNPLGEGFDDSERRQSDFKTLVTSAGLTAVASDASTFDTRSTTRHYRYPADAFLVLNEEVVASGKYYTVVPISYDEYARLMMRPYKYPPKGQVWRLLTHTDSGSYQVIELIGNFASGVIPTYRMRYVKRPSPIILKDLSSDGLSIEGQTAMAACTLPEHLHDEILQRAVLLAKIAWLDPTAPQGQAQQRQ